MKEKHRPWTSGWNAAWLDLLEKNVVIRSYVQIGPDWTGCTTRLAMCSSPKSIYVESVVLNCALGEAVPSDPKRLSPTSHSDFLAHEDRWYAGNYATDMHKKLMSPVAHLATLEYHGVAGTWLLPASHPILVPFYGMVHEQLVQMDERGDETAVLFRRFDAFLHRQQRRVMQQTLGELTP